MIYLKHLFRLVKTMNKMDQVQHSKPIWQKKLWSFIGYVVLFILLYSGLNWIRQPKMPIQGLASLHYTSMTADIPDQINFLQLSQKQPILIYFWGSWCHICHYTSPKINQLTQDYPNQIWSIAVQSGTNTDLHHYLQQYQYIFPVINDETGEIFQQWKGQVTPSYIVLYQGKIVYATTGLQPLWALKLRLKTAEWF